MEFEETVPDPMRSHTESEDRRSRLDELRVETVCRAAGLERSFDGIVEATSHVATDDEHDPEGHTIAFERQQVAALLGEARSQLADLDEAIDRFNAGRYGCCTVCDGPVGDERLDTLPAARTCVGCAR